MRACALRLLDLRVGLSSAPTASPGSSAAASMASNSTTTSPGFTIVPFFASLTICSSPDCIGEASTIDLQRPDLAADLERVDELAR